MRSLLSENLQRQLLPLNALQDDVLEHGQEPHDCNLGRRVVANPAKMTRSI